MRVKPVGPSDAKIFLCGEAPGKDEARLGEPFVGGAGNILNAALATAKVPRFKLFIDNVVDAQPPGNKFASMYYDHGQPNKLLVEQRERLFKNIEMVKPNVIVALGGEAVKALLGGDPHVDGKAQTSIRGSIYKGPSNAKVIPAFHPAYIMRQPQWFAMLAFDLAKAAYEQETRGNFPPIVPSGVIVDPSFEQVMDFISFATERADRIAVDVETLNSKTTDCFVDCVGIAYSGEDAMCIPLFDGRENRYTVYEEAEIIKGLQYLLDSTDTVMQNAPYDMRMLATLGIKVPNLSFDTMIAQAMLYPGMPKSLEFIGSIHTRQPFYKDQSHDDRQTYNCLDCTTTWTASVRIDELLHNTQSKHPTKRVFHLSDLYYDFEHKLIDLYYRVSQRGVLIDQEAKDGLGMVLAAKAEKMQAVLNGAVGYELNVGSNKQMSEFLYEDLGLPIQYKYKKDPDTGRRLRVATCDKEALRKLEDKYGTRLFEFIRELRGIYKLGSTYTSAEVDSDGRMRCSYNVAGTEEARLSSSATPFGTGTNLQNVPKDIRYFVVAPKNKVLIRADLAQADVRVVGYVSGDTNMINIFESGADLHTFVAAKIVFDKPEKDVTSDERQISKKVVHAANYLIMAKTLAAQLGITIERASAILDYYFVTFPNVRLWQNKVKYELKKNRVAYDLFGRRKRWFTLIDDHAWREALAYVPAATVADVVHTAALALDKMGHVIVLNTHDDLVMEELNKDHMIEGAYDDIREAFDITLTANATEFKIPVDIQHGYNWQEVS